MRVLRLIPVFFICLFLTGGHYGMLQFVAWAGMLWSYSEKDGLMQAAQDTFSGEKPCCLCEAIAEAKEGKPDSPEPMQSKGLEKLKELQVTQRLSPTSPVSRDVMSQAPVDPTALLGLARERPLSPPPRRQA